MISRRTPGEEEIRAAYQQGEGAVVALFMHTMSLVEGLAARVKVLEDRLARNSGIVANRRRVMDTTNLRQKVYGSATARKVVDSWDVVATA